MNWPSSLKPVLATQFFVVLSQAGGINDAAVDLTMVAIMRDFGGRTSPTSHNLGPLVVERNRYVFLTFFISSAQVPKTY